MSKFCWFCFLFLAIAQISHGLPAKSELQEANELLQENESVQEIAPLTVFDDQLREFVEYLRLQMSCGHPAAGIPPLAPYQAEHLVVDWKTKVTAVNGDIENLVIVGLDEFDVVKLSWNNILAKLTFELSFDEILVNGKQKLNFVAPFRFHSDGDLLLAFSNIRLFGSFMLRPTLGGKLQMWNLRFSLELGDVKSAFTGVMENQVLTKLFNSWIEEFISVIFIESPEEVSIALQHLIAPRANNVLKQVTVVELIAVILGLANGDLPNKPWCSI